MKKRTEGGMTKEELGKITEYFAKRYPSPRPALKYGSVYQLLVAVILSAQCTDARVNIVTNALFKEYGTPQKMLTLSQAELEKKIYSCGFFRSKAEHILSATRDICDKFGGEVPENYDDLLSLAGVGRKTANVVSAVAFKKPAIAVDTHVFRVSNRLGLAVGKTPLAVEMGLNKVIPEELRGDFHHYLIFYGREVCGSRKPLCNECGISDCCEYYKKNVLKQK